VSRFHGPEITTRSPGCGSTRRSRRLTTTRSPFASLIVKVLRRTSTLSTTPRRSRADGRDVDGRSRQKKRGRQCAKAGVASSSVHDSNKKVFANPRCCEYKSKAEVPDFFMSFNVRHSLLFATLLLSAILVVPAHAQDEEGPPQADLIVTKSGPAQANPGDQVTYSVSISNGGQIDAANVTLEDELPEGMTFVSATQNTGVAFVCSTPDPGDPGAITCTTQTLAVGQTATFTFIMTIPGDAPAGTTFVNIATATTISLETTDENNQGVAGTSTPPPPAADISVTKNGPSGAAPDSDVTYTIVFQNGGPSAAENVSLTDTLPGSMTFVSLDQSGTTLNCTTPAVGAGGTITCTAATYAAGATTTLTLTGHIPDEVETGDTFDNAVAVTTTTLDPNEENNQAFTGLSVSEVDLSVVKTGPPTGIAGQPIAYTITVANAGPDPAAFVRLLDPLPPNTTLVSFQQLTGPLASCSAPSAGSTGTVECTWETLGNGAQATFALSVRPGDTLSVTNVVTISSPSFDSDPSDNQSSVTTTITPFADASVTKSGPATINAGTNITYTLTAANLGPSTAGTVTLTDIMPANTTFVSGTQNSGLTFNCTYPAAGTNGTITCTRASWLPASTATFTFVFAVGSNATGVLANTATIATATDTNAANNSSTSNAAVTTSADLSVVKSGAAAATAGSQITWTINIANAGPSDAANVTLSDTVPANTTLVSFTQNTGPTFNCVTGPTVTCTAPTFAAGAAASFTFIAQIAAGATGTLSNTATIASTTADPNNTNNTSTANVILGANADLRLTKTGPPTTASGANISYSLELVNDGPSAAANVVLTDAVPANTTFVSAVQNTGAVFNCTTPAVGATGTITCTIASFAPGTATFTFTFRVDDDAFAPISNTANVASDTPDPFPTNGVSTAGSAVVPGATDLRITKIANATSAAAGTTATYTIDVINDGPATAVNTTVTDVLPAGTTFVSASSTQGTCTGTTTVTCTIGTLEPGNTATITLMVTLPPTPSLVTNTATVTASNVESDPLDNTSSAAIAVGAGVTAIPTLSPLMLAALAISIAVIALVRR
jgi:uncharacterized repeat protein (TIGR01451 family)